MAEQSGFFNANLVNGEFDRVYLAEHFAKYFASFIGNGIFGGKSDELMVTQSMNSGMKVDVLSGMAWINGFWYENDNNFPNLSLDVSVADGALDRIDNVVLRLGRLEREIKAEVVRGTPASKPVAPALKRDTDYYELKLAEIHVKAGTLNITQAEIVDTRLDSNVCGFVVGLIQQFDTTEFGKQLQSYISNYSSYYKGFIEELEAASRSSIQKIFDRLNDLAVNESALASLAMDVYNNQKETSLVKQTLGYVKKNLIPYPFFEAYSKTSNGITWTKNDDGTVTANGTATEDSYFFLYKGSNFLIPGSYRVTSGTGETTNYFTYCLVTDKESGAIVRDAGRSYNTSPFEIYKSDIEEYNFLVGICVLKGTTLANVVFKPMIREANILDDTWEPYKLSVADMIQEDLIEKGCFFRINSTTKVKEWLNAPDKPGVEYCLTERWNNKPVYQKTFYVASLPVNSVMSIGTSTEWNKVVSVNGYAHDPDDLTYFPFPVILHNQVIPVAVISRVESDGGIVITTNADVSYMQAYITIKYTK